MKIRALQRCIPLAVTAALLVGGAVLLPTFVGVASAAAHSLSIADASVTEGTGAGSTAINLIVSSPALQPADCGFRIVLTHGSSSAADFTVTAFFDVTAVWDTNDADIPRTFQIAQDAIGELNETFTVTITGDAGHPNPCPIGDGVATGTIIDDDGPPPTTASPTTASPTTASPTTALFAPPHATPTTAPPTTAPPAVQPPPARGNIPQTGSFNDDTLRMALALFAAGVALIVFVRRRSVR